MSERPDAAREQPPPASEVPPASPAEASSPSLGLWARLDERLGLVALCPRLSEDVRLRQVGQQWQLVQISTRKVIPLDDDDVPIIRTFDGSRTIAEMIVQSMGQGSFTIEPVLTLVDRLVRAGMLNQYPPDLYMQMVNHLARLSVQRPAPRRASPAQQDVAEVLEFVSEEAARVERPAMDQDPTLVERARFLRGVTLLASLTMEEIGTLAEVADEEIWPATSDIVREGDIADRFYIIRSGEVNVTKLEKDGVRHRIARLGPGDWFGEAGILERAPRNATVRAGTSRPAQLYSFEAGTFERVIRPHVTTHGEHLVSRRRAQLDQIPLFSALAPENLDRLATVLREARAPKGTVLFHQGDQGDRFFIIIEGAVGVVKDGTPIAKLVAGDFFGETALMFTQQRTATVATTEDSRFWVLDRDSFTTFVRDALLHRRELMPTVLNRLGSGEPA